MMAEMMSGKPCRSLAHLGNSPLLILYGQLSITARSIDVLTVVTVFHGDRKMMELSSDFQLISVPALLLPRVRIAEYHHSFYLVSRRQFQLVSAHAVSLKIQNDLTQEVQVCRFTCIYLLSYHHPVTYHQKLLVLLSFPPSRQSQKVHEY
jgi:hypothetical protein